MWRWMIAKCVWDEKTKLGQYRIYQSWDSLGENRLRRKGRGKRWVFNFLRKNEVERSDTGKFNVGEGVAWWTTLCFLYFQRSAAGFECVKSSVFNLHLKSGSDGGDETKTGNVRSPIVEWFDRGMTSVVVFADRSRRRMVISNAIEFSREVQWCNGGVLFIEFRVGNGKSSVTNRDVLRTRND